MITSIYSIVAASSGIPEGLEQVLSSRAISMLLAGLMGICMIATAVTAVLIIKHIGKGAVLACGMIVPIGIAIGGLYYISTIQEDSVADIKAATAQNIEENYVLDDLSLRNIDDYSDENTTVVNGTVDGESLSFKVSYSEKYDTMLPSIEEIHDAPIREDSTLDRVISEITAEESEKQ